jgi:dihydroflavonol-4-reductase
MKAFVTGATGLLGNNLVRALVAEGHTVRALVRSREKAQLLGDTGAELVQGDMQNVAAFAGSLDGCDVVFHTAAYFREYYSAGRLRAKRSGEPRRSQAEAGDHWTKLEAINVRGTLALAEAAHARGVRRFIETNSSGTIGLRPDGSPGDEDTPSSPLVADNLYVKSKRLAGERLREFAARSGLDIVTVMPGWMFGPWDAAPTDSGRLVLGFLDGTMPGIPPGGMNVADARDVAAGMIRAAEHARACARYILAGPFMTVAEIFAALARVTGQAPPKLRIPYPVALSYAAIVQTWAKLTGGDTLASIVGIRMLQAKLRVTSARAEAELGWRPRPFDETLRDEVAWYRSPIWTRADG